MFVYDGINMLRAFFGIFIAATCLSAETYHVYYLGGQSNMDGHGTVSELPADLQAVNDSVPIFHGNPTPDGEAGGGRGLWSKLRAGHGAGFASDGKTNSYSGKFGIEITFARRLKELRPSENVALIKYSRGGTSIDETAARWFGSWEADFIGGPPEHSGVNQYDNFLTTLRNAFATHDIDGDGSHDVLIPAGILWMQGESDAMTATVAKRYGHNLKRLMDLFRAALRVDDLPVVIGRISDSGNDKDGKVWNYGDTVRKAQHGFVDSDTAAAIVTENDNYGHSDPYHYNTSGYVDFGKRFADAIHSIRPE